MEFSSSQVSPQQVGAATAASRWLAAIAVPALASHPRNVGLQALPPLAANDGPAVASVAAAAREAVKAAKGHVDGPIRLADDRPLVGGFAESPILQEAIREEFQDTIKVIIPQVRH